VIILGIFSTRINKEGAIVGMISGLIFTIGYITYFKFISPELNTVDHWWFGISPEGIGSVGMLINFVSCFVVSKFTPAPPKKVQDLIQEIRIPKGAGAAQNH
jgi:cation/acetate symporter